MAGRALLGVVDHAEVREGSMGAVVGEQMGCEECLAAGCLGVADHAEVREGSMEAVVGEQSGCEECLAAGCLGAADHAEGRQGSMEAVVGEQIGCEAGRQGAGQVAVACGLLWVLLSRSLPDSYATRIAMCSIRPDG